ncbi:hypothetical protein [Leifsonia sp. EB34]|uniref:hypothetical protein n=1 Tax=Leifsonia sp. EB34 TaxID=3156303 RepID=UPI00351725B2
MKKILGFVLVVALLGAVAYLERDTLTALEAHLTGAPAPTPSTTHSLVTLGVAPAPRLRFELIDPTTSTNASFRQAMKADTISAVGRVVPPKPADVRGGVRAVVGVQLTVRLVSTDSLSSDAPNYAVAIPSVPALPARPDPTAPGALDPEGPLDSWQKAEKSWSAYYDEALAAQSAAAVTLQSVPVDAANSVLSGITAGTAALALLAPAQGDVAFAVLSDLDENRPRQAANFNGHPVLVVQPDPAGDESRWDTLYASFRSWAQTGGAGDITRVRPEAAVSALNTFIDGK